MKVLSRWHRKTRGQQTENAQQNEELSADILLMMGQRLAPDRIPAQAVHKDLVVRIEEIIKNGLPVEERTKLIQKFLHQAIACS